MRYGHLIPKIYPTGVFIQSIEQTESSNESGGDNVFTVTLTNHTQQRFVVKNGHTRPFRESINEIRASVDNSVGTPTVEVVETDAGAKKNIHFIFKNLKGETGDVALTEEGKQYISQSVASANQYTDDSIREVKQHIDTRYANTLQNANDYTDQQIHAEAQARAQEDSATLAYAKRYTNDLLIKIFQNGYIQWPGMPSPLEDTSLHFDGYSWYEVNYDGNFFRAKGRNAKAFSAKKLTVDHIKNGAYIFHDDEQVDTIRDISGVFGSDIRQPNIFSETSVGRSGCFEATKEPTRGGLPSGKTAADNGKTEGLLNIKFRASRAVPTSNENRPRNLTFTIWVLVKDE